jgi:hypothetical protein
VPTESEVADEVVDLGWAELEKPGRKKKQAVKAESSKSEDTATEEDARVCFMSDGR